MPQVPPIGEALQEGVIIFDGAMGTEIYRRDVLTNRCFDELCITDADIIRSIHAEYCGAGADVLTTNTFGATTVMLAHHGLEEKAEAINRAGVRLAKEVADAAERPVWVAGSIGPIKKEATEEVDVVAAFRRQAAWLIDAGADFILFETQPTREMMEQCAMAMEGQNFPFIISCTVYDDLESGAGEPLQRLFAPMPAGAAMPCAWGINCGAGPDATLTAAERVMRLIDRPLVVMPNAGMPREIGGRQIYLCSPDYIAGYAKRYINIGVRGIGGCCGTNASHILEIARRIKPLAKKPTRIVQIEVGENVEPQPETAFEHKSRLAWRLAHKRWVTSVELIPPRGFDMADMVEKAKTLHRHGVDAVNIPDGPRASSRISPLITALTIQQEAQIETILHFCCRDRNLIGMQADLLACAKCNIRNILFVTGDPPKLGKYPFASGVFDMDSIGLCGVQKRLNQGIDLGGQAISPKMETVIGVGADPTALDLDREIRRFEQKVEAGAEFAITQPVFDPDALFRFLDRIEHLNIPVLAGLWPLASYRNAMFLRNEVPGVVVPDEIMDRMARATGKDDQRMTGIAIARELVERVRHRVGGIQISPPFGNVYTALDVINSC